MKDLNKKMKKYVPHQFMMQMSENKEMFIDKTTVTELKWLQSKYCIYSQMLEKYS